MFSFLLHFCLGWVAGTALQLQQATLWPAAINLAGLCISIFLLFTQILCRHRFTLPVLTQCFFVLVVSTASAFFLCASRAQIFLEKQIPPKLEGQVLEVVGRVTAMPQQMQANIRFRFAAQTAQLVSG